LAIFSRIKLLWQKYKENFEIIIEILILLFTFEQNFGKMSIGGKVRKYRIHKGLSQRTLAESVDVSQSIISSLESDKSIPNSIMLNRIAKELDIDINDLLKDENVIQNNSDKAIGNIHSQVTINNHFPENIIEILLSNNPLD